MDGECFQELASKDGDDLLKERGVKQVGTRLKLRKHLRGLLDLPPTASTSEEGIVLCGILSDYKCLHTVSFCL